MFGFLLHPVRTMIFALLAGLIGFAIAREQAHDACVDAGGTMKANICRGVN